MRKLFCAASALVLLVLMTSCAVRGTISASKTFRPPGVCMYHDPASMLPSLPPDTVIVQADINALGAVTKAYVVKSVPGYDEVCLASARSAAYTPAIDVSENRNRSSGVYLQYIFTHNTDCRMRPL